MNGNICEKCKNSNFKMCLKKKCVKKSYVKSLICTIESYFNKIHNTYKKIDYIITPSNFYQKKFIEYGFDKNKIISLPNFLSKDEIEYDISDDNNYFLYFGRLSEEKGLLTLIEAALKTNIKLKIAGTGPIEKILNEKISKANNNNIELLGFKSGKDLNTLIFNAKAVILPSEWYENGPYSAIETLKLGVPLIGANIGGIPELIIEGENRICL